MLLLLPKGRYRASFKPDMGTRYPVARTARRVTYKIQTHDVRRYLFEDVVQRTRHAVTHAGGQLLGGVYAPPKHIKRWCVLRSPHVNKKSREHFWMVTHRRVFKWDAGPDVGLQVPKQISRMLPPTVAVRTCLETPGLMALKDVFDTLESAREGGTIASGQESTENTSEEVVDKEQEQEMGEQVVEQCDLDASSKDKS